MNKIKNDIEFIKSGKLPPLQPVVPGMQMFGLDSSVKQIHDKDTPTLYDVQDIQEMFKCGKSTAYKIMTDKGFPSIRVCRRLYVERKALESWLNANRGKIAIV